MGGFAVLFHCPNQVLASMQTVKRYWVQRDNSTNHYMNFNLKRLEVNEKRYKKRQNNCILNWKNYDNMTLRNHLNKVGSKTPDQISNETWPICRSQEKMNEARLHLNSNNVHPCKEVESVDYDMGESEELSSHSYKTFQGQYWKNWICLVYRVLNPRFKVVLQKKEVDFQALIGYIGGYIGIFTGFAIVQIPDMIFTALVVAKKWILSRKTTNKIIILPHNSHQCQAESF
jgi:hypothetical protein